MIRKTIFWTHLVCGVLAGAAILTMSFTGVVLTYERQILAWLEEADYVEPQATEERMSLEQLSYIARTRYPQAGFSSIIVKSHPGAPVQFSGGRGGPSFNLDPYSGEEMEVGSPGLDRFFSAVTGFHRWFNMEGEARDTARAITGASNLMFLFLILSGMYLWLPRIWKWGMFKTRLLFNGKAESGRARDFNWHHVFGIWSAIPLAVVVATASVFYYPWANDLVYYAFGEEPPGRGGGGPGGGGQSAGAGVMGSSLPGAEVPYLSLDQLFARAADAAGEWRQISITPPRSGRDDVQFAIDRGNGGQPQHRHSLSLDRQSGAIIASEPFTSQSPGRQARSIIRYLHTGEVLGILGQTIAGLVSLTSLIMVWTGLALAWRRLIQPLFRKN